MHWLCYYIYYQNDYNFLLRKCISPLLNNLESKYGLKQFFFLRYWKGGPHLRLRVKVSQDNHLEIAKDIEDEVGKFLLHFPSETTLINEQHVKAIRKFAKLENELLVDTTMKQNNTIYREEYIAETEKYGGNIGVGIAEEVFCVSSKLCINHLVNNSENKNYYIHLLINMFTAVKAFKFTLQESINFFSFYYKYWSENLTTGSSPSDNPLKNIYLRNSDQLIHYFKESHEKNVFLTSDFEEWHAILQRTRIEISRNIPSLQQAIVKNYLGKYIPMYLLTHYIHTNNNRFGIQISEEAFLGYLALSTIRDYMLVVNKFGKN